MSVNTYAAMKRGVIPKFRLREKMKPRLGLIITNKTSEVQFKAFIQGFRSAIYLRLIRGTRR